MPLLQFATGAGEGLEGSHRESVVQREDLHDRSGTTLSGPLGSISERRKTRPCQGRVKKIIRFYVIVNISHYYVLSIFSLRKRISSKLIRYVEWSVFEVAFFSLSRILSVGILE